MDEEVTEEEDGMTEDQVSTLRRVALLVLLIAVVVAYAGLTVAALVR